MSAALLALVVIVAVLEFAPYSEVAKMALTPLASQLERLSALVAPRLLRVALLALPASERDDQFDEWIDHLEAARGSCAQTLILAVGLTARGIPGLACRSRLRQTLDVLLPVGTGRIVALDGARERGTPRRPLIVQGALQKPIRLTFIATRHPVLFGSVWGVDVIYTVSMPVDGAPEIARIAVVRSKLFPRTLSRLVRHVGYAATDRSFADATVYAIGHDPDCCLPQDEIATIFATEGHAAIISLKMPPHRSGVPPPG